MATVRFAAVRFDLRATLPAIVSVAKDWLAPIAMVRLVPVKVTEEPVEVNAVTDDESHDPAMAIEAKSKTRVAEPVEVTLPLKVTVVPARVSAPDHGRLEDKVTVLESFVNVAPTPDVSQLPLTLQAPPVSVMVPEVPPFIVTSAAETVEAFATRIPESPTAMEPPVKERFAVASVVVDPAPSCMVRTLL